MEENKNTNNEPEKKEDYRFLKEVIKEKPRNPRALLIKVGCIIGGAILFGLVAAFVFVQFVSLAQQKKQKPAQVEFEADDPYATGTPAPTPTPMEAEASQEPGTLGIEEYENIYSEMNDIAREAMKSMVTVTGITSNEDWFNITTESTRQASGILVANNGQELLILTEYRAVDMVDRIMITFWDDTIVDGRYQKQDPNTGLTIVKVPLADMESTTKEGLIIASLGNSYSVVRGEPVIAIGSPMGYSNSVVHGQVTSMTNTISTIDTEYNLLTTNILGSSTGSGALVNLQGQIVGVMAQALSGGSEKNVITGLPISQLKFIIETLSNNQDVPYLGIRGQNVTSEISRQTGMPKGVYAGTVSTDSPALQAGIQNADILVKFNGDDVENISRYHDKLSKTKVGDTVTITVMRKGAEGYVEFEFPVAVGTQ